MSTYAWIGLGNMGAPMAANLVRAGHTVKGCDPAPAALERAAKEGIQPVSSIAEAVADADVVFTMLPRGEHVRSVYGDETGIWANADTSALLIDSSTVDIETSQFCHDGSAERGFRFVDAPVSGGISGAAAATLGFMLGGTPEDVDEATGHVQAMSGNTIIAGGPTNGTAAKICNNMMLFINLVAASEGAQLAERMGLDAKVFWSIASVSSGRSWAQQTWYPVPGVVESAAANNNYAATFRADLALKDITLAVAAGDSSQLNLPGAKLAQSQFQKLVDEGLGDMDCSLITKFVSPDDSAPGFSA